MPTYDYKCSQCDHEVEIFQSITAKPLKKCPHCGANKLQRLIGTGGGIIFKGGGFYQTDYRSESYKQAAAAETKAPAAPDAKDAKSTAAAPADKTTPAAPTEKGGSAAAEKAPKSAPKKPKKSGQG